MIPTYTPIKNLKEHTHLLNEKVDTTRQELTAQLREIHNKNTASLQALIKVLDECEVEIQKISQRRIGD